WDHAGVVARGADYAKAVDLLEPRGGPVKKLGLVGGYALHPHGFEVVDGRGKTSRAGDVRRTRFELVWNIVPDTPIETHHADHLAAALPRWHRLEVFRLRDQRANAGGRIHLVAGKCVEIRIKGLHVDAGVRHGLRAVHEDGNPTRMRHIDDPLYRVHRAERI